MKPNSLLHCLTAFIFTACSCSHAALTGLFNTGVDDAGLVRAAGLTDIHYSLTGPASQAYVQLVVYHYNGGSQAWVTPPANSSWIGPTSEVTHYPDAPIGEYTYTIQFNYIGSGAADLRLSGVWASDNDSSIWVNGNYTGYHKESWPAFLNLTPFSVTGFVEGLNTIQFKVRNIYSPVLVNPSGLLVSFNAPNIPGTSGETPVPEPSTLIAGALLTLPFGFSGLQRLRRRKA